MENDDTFGEIRFQIDGDDTEYSLDEVRTYWQEWMGAPEDTDFMLVRLAYAIRNISDEEVSAEFNITH